MPTPHRIDVHHHIVSPGFVEELRSLLQPPTLNWTPDHSIEDLDQAVVFVHPEAPLCCRGLLAGVHEAVLEYGFDTTRAITRILFSGTALRYRDIRWIFCHGGGTTPFLAERLLRAPGLNKSLAQYVPDGGRAALHRVHYDVARIAHPLSLAAL